MPERSPGTISSSRLAAVFAETARTSPYDEMPRSSRGVKCIRLCKILGRTLEIASGCVETAETVSVDVDRAVELVQAASSSRAQRDGVPFRCC
jgi:hypothetical protein